MEPAGLIFNHLEEELDTAAITNKGIAEELTGVPVLMDVIRGQEEVDAWPFQEMVEGKVEIGKAES